MATPVRFIAKRDYQGNDFCNKVFYRGFKDVVDKTFFETHLSHVLSTGIDLEVVLDRQNEIFFCYVTYKDEIVYCPDAFNLHARPIHVDSDFYETLKREKVKMSICSSCFHDKEDDLAEEDEICKGCKKMMEIKANE